MKTFFAVAMIFIVAFCLGAPEPKAGSAPPEFNAVQEIANTRVTLLQISQVASFTRQFNENEEEFRQFTPGVEVVFLVEQIGDGPKERTNHGGSRLFANGKPLLEADGVVAGGSGGVQAYSRSTLINGHELPDVNKPARAKIVRDYIRGVTADAPSLDLQLKFGFGELQSFDFSGVPL